MDRCGPIDGQNCVWFLLPNYYFAEIGHLSGRLAFLFSSKGAIPIIASVAEHQPTSWAHYYYDLHLLVSFSSWKVAKYLVTQYGNRCSYFMRFPYCTTHFATFQSRVSDAVLTYRILSVAAVPSGSLPLLHQLPRGHALCHDVRPDDALLHRELHLIPNRFKAFKCVYLQRIMVRIVLVLAPAACVLGGKILLTHFYLTRQIYSN